MTFFYDRFKRGKGIPPSATFRLTQQGTEKLQEFNGDPKSQILMALETGGSSNIAEISQTSGLSRGQVERLIPSMAKGGYIQHISASGGELD